MLDIGASMRIRGALLMLALAGLTMARAGDDRSGSGTAPGAYTGFDNRGGVAYTRHNLSQHTLEPRLGSGSLEMDPYRNNYREVCVYCHTPHAASGAIKAPLWNRTVRETTYTTYGQLGSSSLGQAVEQPGAASLTCLSCHDGQTAVDSVINMPGPGRVEPKQARVQNDAFLDSWQSGRVSVVRHQTLSADAGEASCLSCHSPGRSATAVDFTVAAIGTDLRNDHPVGIAFPLAGGVGSDYNAPVIRKDGVLFFDANGNGRMDKEDVRLYNAGEGARVECASCHDPHGVPLNGAPEAPFIGTFLRVGNHGSGLCLTCHNK